MLQRLKVYYKVIFKTNQTLFDKKIQNYMFLFIKHNLWGKIENKSNGVNRKIAYCDCQKANQSKVVPRPRINIEKIIFLLKRFVFKQCYQCCQKLLTDVKDNIISTDSCSFSICLKLISQNHVKIRDQITLFLRSF